jgi:hypothetical protein
MQSCAMSQLIGWLKLLALMPTNSPRLELNIALAMISADCAEIVTEIEIVAPQGLARAIIVKRPFYDPQKKTGHPESGLARLSAQDHQPI